MFLGSCRAKCPDELRADFQQFYNLNIDGMGTDYSLTHAAALAAQLPAESRVIRKAEPRARWGDTEYLLSAIEFNTRVLAWQKTKDGRKGRKKPKPIAPPDGKKARAIKRTNRKHIDEVLGRR